MSLTPPKLIEKVQSDQLPENLTPQLLLMPSQELILKIYLMYFLMKALCMSMEDFQENHAVCCQMHYLQVIKHLRDYGLLDGSQNSQLQKT